MRQLLRKLKTKMQKVNVPVPEKLQPLLKRAQLLLGRYFAWKHSWKTSTVVLLALFVVVLLGWNVLHTSAATYIMVPDGDTTSAWSPVPSGTHYTTVDEGGADDQNDYVQVASTNTSTGVTDQYTLSSPTTIASATQVVLRIWMSGTVASNGTMNTISLNLTVGGVAQTATLCTPSTVVNTWTACTATYSGSWTQTNVDSMQVSMVRNLTGSGSAASKAGTVKVANVYGTLTYTSNIQFNQSAYRWFNNQDSSAGGSGTFSPRTDYTAGTNPEAVFAADFNGDGKKDLAVANNTSNTVSVFIGSGTGTFAAKVDYTTGSAPSSVVAADYSGDGKIDLAVTNANSNTVSVFIGSGTGTFAAKVDYTTGGSPNSVVAADYNGDSKIDLAVGNYGSDSVSVFIGSGTGTFAAKVDYTTGTSPQSVVAADYNGDSKIDLATTNYTSNTVSVFIGSGTGTFATKVDYTTGTSPYSVTAADFNGDSKLDMAVANSGSNSVSVFIGSGTGTFATKVDYATGTSPTSVINADFNGDNVPDLATANYGAGTVSVPLGNANPIDVKTSPQLATAQNTSVIAPAEGTMFRLRVDLHVSGSQASAGGAQFKLRYALKGASATCSVVPGANYNDVSGSSNGIRFGDNPLAASGIGLTANASDPVHNGTDTNVLQSYQETGTTTFTNSTSIPATQDGMWDFGLVAYQSIGGDTYCFKVVNSDNSDLNSGYTQYPEITIPTATFSQASYRWYGGAASSGAATYSVGDTGPAGGKIFYDSGFTGSGKRYMEAGPADAGTDMFGCSGTFLGTSTAIGAGYSNTLAMESSSCFGADTATGYTSNGFNDFFLPSVNEIKQLFGCSCGITGLSASTNYLTSTDLNTTSNTVVNSTTQASSNVSKSLIVNVRSVRQFDPSPLADVGTPSGIINKPLDTLKANVPLALRVAIRADDSGVAVGGLSYKLQYKRYTDASVCSSTSGYSDVTSGSAGLRFYNDPSHATGDALAVNSNDPVDGTRTMRVQTYQEANNFTNSISPIYAGEDGIWQFSLIVDSATLGGSNFCIRVTPSAGGTPITAVNIPEVAFAPQMSQIMKGGKWFSRSGIKQNLIL